MAIINRVSIDQLLPIDSHKDAHAARGLTALTKGFSALDQVVNRAYAEECERGNPGSVDDKPNADDFAEAERHAGILEIGARAMREGIAKMKAQFPAVVVAKPDPPKDNERVTFTDPPKSKE